MNEHGESIPSVREVENEMDKELKDYCLKIDQKTCESGCEILHCHLNPNHIRPAEDEVII